MYLARDVHQGVLEYVLGQTGLVVHKLGAFSYADRWTRTQLF